MTPKKFKTRSVSRERHGTYLKKAQEFLRASESALKLGESTGDSHHDVAGLLLRHVKDDQLGSKIQTLSKALGYKNLAAYEDREVTEAEGRDAEKLARRFLEWAQSRLA
ncbi:MAG: hypothetical protein A3G41_05035 [Elusimicrobia bacterium RIFCSPLOWO2_12_FULL_59_9]|nr:MAG: hypothetical protein A3G41_05035 [Elusimicrobia bacterium RIFCSPLOWO2_12_FULL_59_9]